MKKKAVTMLFTLATLLSLSVSTVFATHTIPNSGGQKCNNTYKNYTHTGYVTSASMGSHTLSNGSSCARTMLVYFHNISCNACSYVYNNQSSLGCTEVHSSCGTTIVNH